MPAFSEQIVEDIRSRCDIVELISERIPLKRSGADFKACCPFHNEKTPSFLVSPSRRAFHCFGCGVKGDVFAFLMLADGLTFPEAVRALANRCGIAIEALDDPQASHRKDLIKLHNDLAGFFERCLAQIAEAAPARDYIAKRKLPPEIVRQFRIGYVPERKDVLSDWASHAKYPLEHLVECGFLSPPRPNIPSDGYFNKFHGRLIFPICDQSGQVVAFSGRILKDDKHAPKYYNSPETPIFRKSRILYGLCFAKKSITRNTRREVLVCEGQIDVIRCHACGFTNAVASQGTAFTEDHVALLKAYADSAVLVFDGDAAGHKAATRTGRLFLAAGLPVRIALLPEGEDPDSILRDHGPDAFQKILDASVSLAAFQIGFFLKNEPNPHAIDSVSRITSDLFETFSACSKAVLRSCLIQESADLLSIPLNALESDYQSFQADADRRKKWQEQLHASSPSSPQNSSPHTPPPSPSDSLEIENLPPEFYESPDSPPPPRTPHTWQWRETALLALSEILIKTSVSPTDEDAAIALLAEQWLPKSILTESSALQNIVSACLDDSHDHGDRLSLLASNGSDEEKALIDHLARRTSPIFKSDLPLTASVQSLITRIWIDFLRIMRDNTSRDSEDNSLTRLRITSLLRRLESSPDWNTTTTLLSEII